MSFGTTPCRTWQVSHWSFLTPGCWCFRGATLSTNALWHSLHALAWNLRVWASARPETMTTETARTASARGKRVMSVSGLRAKRVFDQRVELRRRHEHLDLVGLAQLGRPGVEDAL